MFHPTDVLTELGGAGSGTTLRKLCGANAVRRAVANGSIIRAARNRYVLPGGLEALSAAARLSGVTSHLSAARFWGWKVRQEPRSPDVTVDPRRRIDARRRLGITVHWQQLEGDDVAPPGVTTRVRTVLDCARALPIPDALSVADSALREGLVTRDALDLGAVAGPRRGRARARRVISLADPRAANPFESSLRAICLEVPGLAVTPQYPVAGVGFVDLVDPVLMLALEADSYSWHGSQGAFVHDIRRYAALVRAGFTVVRFCWHDVMFEADFIRLLLIDLVARGPDTRPVAVSATDHRLIT